MALASNSKYATAIDLAAGSAPSGDVGLYATAPDDGNNAHLVLQAHTASFTGDVHVTGTLHVEGTINSTNREETNLIVEDKTITVASGSNAANTDGAGLVFGGSDSVTAPATILYDNANSAIDFTIGGTTELRLQDGVLRPETDSDVTLGADGAAWSTVYADNIDLNGQGRIDLDADADTSIRGDVDDQITYEIGGTDTFIMRSNSFYPAAGTDVPLGAASTPWADLFLGDGGVINFNSSDVTMTHASNLMTIAGGNTRVDRLEIDGANDYIDVDTDLKLVAAADIVLDPAGGDVKADGNLLPNSADGGTLGSAAAEWSDLFLADGGVANFGNDQDVTLTHVADTGLLLNSSRQLQFGDSGTYIHQSSDGVLELASDVETRLGNADTDSVGVTGSFSIYNVNVGQDFLSYQADQDYAIINGGSIFLQPYTRLQLGLAGAEILAVAQMTASNGLFASAGLNATTMSASSNLQVGGTADFDGAVTMDNTLAVAGNFSVGSYGLTTAGAATIASMAGNWTNAGREVADMGNVLTMDLDGGSIDGTTIGANSAAAGTFTTLTATSLELTEGNALNVGRIEADTIQGDDATVGLNLNFDSNTGTDKITLADGQADALSVTDGTNDWMVFNTDAETLTFGRNMSAGDYNLSNVGVLEADTIQGDDATVGLNLNFDSNTGLDKITLTDGQADALSITDGSNDWMVFNTSAETLTVGKASTFSAAISGSSTLDVNGAATFNSSVQLGDSSSDAIDVQGTITATTAITATEFVATSDARLKSDIQVVDNAIDAINSIQGVEYDLDVTGEHSMGVLAQDLLEVAPSLVKTDKNGMYAVNYSGLSALFVEAIKEQQAQIEDLKNTVKELSK